LIKKGENMYLMHHICIQTDKYEQSKAFYMSVLGFEVMLETADFHDRDYNTWLIHGDIRIELQTNKRNEEPIAFNKKSNGLGHFCLYVKDLDQEYQRLLNIGFDNFKKKNGLDIYEVEGGKLLKILAPEGTIIELRDTMDL